MLLGLGLSMSTPPQKSGFPFTIAAPVLVGTVSDKAASTTRTIVTTADVPAGSTLIVVLSSHDPSDVATPGGSDGSNTYTEDFAPSTGVTEFRWFRSSNVAGLLTGTNINITGMISGQAVTAHAFYIQGLTNVSPLDGTNSGTGSSDAVTSGNISTPAVETIVLGGLAVAGLSIGIEDPAYTTIAAAGTSGGTATDNRSCRVAYRKMPPSSTLNYAATTGNSSTRFVSIMAYKAP